MKFVKLLLAVAGLAAAQFSASAQTVPYNGGTLSESFDGMGVAGTTTPSGWFVASNAAAVLNYTTTVAVNNGSAAPNAGVRGFNLGTNGVNLDTDRALGTGPTGSDRYIEVRIRNATTTSSMTAINVHWDGEQWRTGSAITTTNRVVLQLSTDGVNYNTNLGAAFTFIQPSMGPASVALDGNIASNRVANIGGAFTLPSSVPPGGTLFLRWFDFNEGGTDPILAIDNFNFSATMVNEAVTIAITSPTNNQTLIQSADLPVTTTTTGAITNVNFLVNGVVVTNDTSSPFSAVLPSSAFPTVGNYTVQAIAYDFNGVQTPSATVTVHVIANQSPSVSIVSSFSGFATGTTFAVGSAITNRIVATDDVAVTNVAFYVDNAFVFNRTAASNAFTNVFYYIDALAGAHTLQAVAYDKGGLTATSAVVSILVTNPPSGIFTVLIANGSDWKYFATSNAPPEDASHAQWYQTGFDDSTWSSGLAELGGGDFVDGYPERTSIDLGPATDRFRAMYFRKVFDVSDHTLFQNLVVNLLFDDGAVVYLNGSPVWTNNFNITNLANGISYTNFANGAPNEGTAYDRLNLDPNLFLVDGPNTIAVEVHQNNATSSDLSFDLMLWGEAATLPEVTITTPTNNQAFRIGSNVTVNVSSSTFVTNINFLVDGLFIGQDGTKPFSGIASNLAIGTHEITVQGDDQFGNQAVASVTIQVVGNNPPTITIGSPAPSTNVLVGSTVLITNIVAADSDGTISRVDFYFDDRFYFTAPTSPYWMEVGDLLVGTHVLTAVAVDNDGGSASNSVSLVATNPLAVTLLVTNGSTWKYFDLGTDPGANWFAPNFPPEATWSNGVAELGFGDELLAQQHRPQQTLISKTNAAGAVNAAYYFRHHFTVADPSAFNNLIVNVLRDDGAIVYINGVEVFRSNFTNNPAYYTNLAPVAATDDGAVYQRSTNAISPSLLVAGDNVLAVEIHQDSLTSSDISFDLMLWAAAGGGPRLSISTDGTHVDVSWAGSGFTLQQNTNVGNSGGWQAVSGNPQNLYHFTPAGNQPALFFRLIK